MISRFFIVLALSIGPWLTDMGKDCFTVLWKSDAETLGFVELADGTRVYEEFAGRRVHGTLHTIQLKGFEPGQIVEYTIGEQPILDKTNPRRPIYGEPSLLGTYTTRTFNPRAKSCRFSILNDVHMNLRRYKTLLAQIDSSSTDFIFLNGDVISAGHHSVDTLIRYEVESLGSLGHGIPVAFARGNHEGRGDGIRNVSLVYPKHNTEFPFTYIFREGPVAFLVFDAGETHPKNSDQFCGKPVYEDYINAQMAWASKAVKCREWRTAKVRIALSHVTMYAGQGSDRFDNVILWMGQNTVNDLNKFGVDLLLNADLHEYMYTPEGSFGNKFPIVVNDNESRVDVKVQGRSILVDIISEDGALVHEHKF